MFRRVAFVIAAVSCLFLGAWVVQESKPSDAGAPKAATPADGYTVHVTAPHLVNGHVMGPYHHYCKVLAPDPYIVCQIYDSADPNGTLSQIEFIIAKKLTRPAVNLNDWNRLWHDHTVEIAGGRVQVLDLPLDKAKEVNFDFDGKLPNGKITMAQAVGHKPLSASEYEQSKKGTTGGPGSH